MDKKGFIEELKEQFLSGKKKHTKTTIEKLAKGFGINNKNLVKELTELVLVLNARAIAHNAALRTYDKYQAIVSAYKSQVNISMRTSMSVLYQQYSTPSPISFLASSYVLSDDVTGLYFEPSAGNGLLTIALPYARTIVNEIDTVRNDNLKYQPYLKVMKKDASEPFSDFRRRFAGVVTNPPFGKLLNPVTYNDFTFKVLDHAMCINALNCMADNGKAAMIVGGHTRYDKSGRPQSGKNRIFLNYLYHHYNVEDVISIDGKELYSRQGTAVDVRLILINGRKSKPEGFAPVVNDELAEVVTDFDRLWDRVGLSDVSPEQAHLKLRARAIILKKKRARTKAKADKGDRPTTLSYRLLNETQKHKVDLTYNSTLKKIGSKRQHPSFKAAYEWIDEKLLSIKSEEDRALIALVVEKLKAEEARRKQANKAKREEKKALIERNGIYKPKYVKLSNAFYYDLANNIKRVIEDQFDIEKLKIGLKEKKVSTLWLIYRVATSFHPQAETTHQEQKEKEKWMDRYRKEDVPDDSITSALDYIVKEALKNYK